PPSISPARRRRSRSRRTCSPLGSAFRSCCASACIVAATATTCISSCSPSASNCRAASAVRHCARPRSATRNGSNTTSASTPATGSTGMTSGIPNTPAPRLLLIATLLLPMAASAAPPDAPDAARIVASLRRELPARTPFVEVRWSSLLDRPLVLRGELEYAGPGHLSRRVDAPYREEMTVAGGEASVQRGDREARTFPLGQAPEREGFLRGFQWLRGGAREGFHVERKRNRRPLAPGTEAARCAPGAPHPDHPGGRLRCRRALLPHAGSRRRSLRAAGRGGRRCAAAAPAVAAAGRRD